MEHLTKIKRLRNLRLRLETTQAKLQEARIVLQAACFHLDVLLLERDGSVYSLCITCGKYEEENGGKDSVMARYPPKTKFWQPKTPSDFVSLTDTFAKWHPTELEINSVVGEQII